jgi:hypothetical protein
VTGRRTGEIWSPWRSDDAIRMDRDRLFERMAECRVAGTYHWFRVEAALRALDGVTRESRRTRRRLTASDRGAMERYVREFVAGNPATSLFTTKHLMRWVYRRHPSAVPHSVTRPGVGAQSMSKFLAWNSGALGVEPHGRGSRSMVWRIVKR